MSGKAQRAYQAPRTTVFVAEVAQRDLRREARKLVILALRVHATRSVTATYTVDTFWRRFLSVTAPRLLLVSDAGVLTAPCSRPNGLP